MNALHRTNEETRRSIPMEAPTGDGSAFGRELGIRPSGPIRAVPRNGVPREVEDRPVITSYRLNYGLPAQPAQEPLKRWVRSAVAAVGVHRWLITGFAIFGGLLGFLFTVKICVPLFRVQASIEVQNAQSDAHTQALAHTVESQSVVSQALTSLSEVDQSSLVEQPRFPMSLITGMDPNQTLHNRLTASALTGAHVIDITFVSPNPVASEHFVNALIRALAGRTEDLEPLKPLTSGATGASVSTGTEQEAEPAKAVNVVSIIDPAISTGDPVSPSAVWNVAVGVVCGVLLGAVIALVRKFGLKTFSGPGSVGDVLGLRELGTLPTQKLLTVPTLVPMRINETPIPSLQIDANDESIRHLRSSLLYHPSRRPINCLAFTSASPSEGRTSVVASLGMSLAATGRRVLLIDGDFRRPSLHKMLQVESSPGLADLLRRNPDDLTRYAASTSFHNLFVLPPGTAGEDARELLAGSLLATILREFMLTFDFVLVDTPPLLVCSDARNYALAVDGVVMVVHSSETQKREALMMRDMLLQDGANIIGTVLTGCEDATPAYHYATT